MKNEEWKSIKGFENYEVSNMGRVFDISVAPTERIVPTTNKTGHSIVVLSNNGISRVFSIHLLVARLFLFYISSYGRAIVVHINNDKSNNCASNLRVIVRDQNTIKTIKNTKQ